MSNDSIGAVPLIESIDQERLILNPALNSIQGALQNLLGSIHENLIDMICNADLIEQRIERLNPCSLRLNAHGVTKSEQSFKVTKSHRCTGLAHRFETGRGRSLTPPTAIPVASHDTAVRVGERKRL